MPKVDRAQLFTLVGDKAPAAVGESCAVPGTVCAPPINAVTRACSGFQGVCGSTGTEDIIPLGFFCFPTGAGAGVCTAVVTGSQQTRSCTVSTNGKTCSTGCGGEFCSPYTTSCDAEADKVRTCHSGGTCSNDQCVNETTTTEVTGTCTRDTEGGSCSQNEIRPIGSFCSSPRRPICDPNQVCRCLSQPL
jgi:hypothetical protein